MARGGDGVHGALLDAPRARADALGVSRRELAATHVSMIDFTQSFTRVAFRLRSVGSGHCAVVGALALRLDPTE